ncbi:MAG: nucleotidyltransferase domain-containing protein [Epsilonproteobacteria bacterium]|nr:nucleotidyltransferase domain-containing protein [Campylobacterota bacterium]
MTRESVLKTLEEKKSFIQEQFSVEKIGVFGSYAKEIQTDKSDIDFYVEFKDKTFDNLAGLWVYLEELFHTKVDIVHKHKNNNQILIERIKSEVVYG